jgi:hypothetical protein
MPRSASEGDELLVAVIYPTEEPQSSSQSSVALPLSPLLFFHEDDLAFFQGPNEDEEGNL